MKTTANENLTGLVLRFSTISNPNTAAKLHSENCPQAKNVRHANVTPADKETIQDLKERGFPVRKCPCCK